MRSWKCMGPNTAIWATLGHVCIGAVARTCCSAGQGRGKEARLGTMPGKRTKRLRGVCRVGEPETRMRKRFSNRRGSGSLWCWAGRQTHDQTAMDSAA